MRARRLVAALVVLVAAPASAFADDKLVAEARAKGRVLTDGKGHFVMFSVADPSKLIPDENLRGVWYGDGKTMNEVRVRYANIDQTAHFSVRDPRVDLDEGHSTLLVREHDAVMVCDDRKTTLSIVSDTEARALAKKAVFAPMRNQRSSYVLGRDGTTYYYADSPADVTAATAKQLRLFIGKRGAMKEVKVTRVDADRAGTVITTARGVLRSTRPLVTLGEPSARDQTLMWIAKGKPTLTLPDLDLTMNGKLIFAELGVYPARLGLPCDDL